MHTDHCPDCFAALEETESGDYGCPSHGHIEEAFWLTADEVATQARELHEARKYKLAFAAYLRAVALEPHRASARRRAEDLRRQRLERAAQRGL